MRTPRIYLNQDISKDAIIELPKEIGQHLIKVIKRKTGNNIILFNGYLDNQQQYGEYTAELIECSKRSAKVRVLEYISKDTTSIKCVELAQCVSKGSHFDVSLQKAVELGVNIISPIISERAEQMINDENVDKKMARWQKIIISAAEQSGRTEIPLLNPPTDIKDWLKQFMGGADKSISLIGLCTKTNNSLHKLALNSKDIKTIKVIIGPEGGFSELEIKLLEQTSFNLVKLGNRIMRTETASIASLAIVQYLTMSL